MCVSYALVGGCGLIESVSEGVDNNRKFKSVYLDYWVIENDLSTHVCINLYRLYPLFS